MKAKNVNQIFKVPNTPQGRLFIELLKEYKSPCYNIVCKGRTINRKKAKNQKMSKREIRARQDIGNIPMSVADNIGVYITTQDNQRIGASNEQHRADLQKRFFAMKDKLTESDIVLGKIRELVL